MKKRTKEYIFFFALILLALCSIFLFYTHSAMQKTKIIFTEKAPKPIGPYSQAVLHGNMLFVSGQIAINPATGELDTSNIENETRQVMENIRAIVEAAGMKMSDVVKASIFLTDLSNFSRVNEVYGRYFTPSPNGEGDGGRGYPARETLQVAALPKNVHVEISVVAVKNDSNIQIDANDAN